MFIVLEIQKTDSIATLVFTAETRNEGESKYHQVLAAAAISSVPIHSAMLISEDGLPLAYASYTHGSTPESDE